MFVATPLSSTNTRSAGASAGVTARYATRTRTTWSNFGDCVDFFAPGSGITAASWADDSSSRSISGTSMAAPHVAGAAALYLERNKRAEPAAVNQALSDATTKGVVTTSLTTNNHLLHSLF